METRSYAPRASMTLDDLMNDLGATDKSWQETIYEEDELAAPKFDDSAIEKREAELETQEHSQIDAKKEEDELHYYKNKLAEQVEATREILGNFQLVSRRSKMTEGVAERYKEELVKQKEYLNHLLDQQTAALSSYKNKILLLDRERGAYKAAYSELAQSFEKYQEEAQEHLKKLTQRQSDEELEHYIIYIKNLQETAKLQTEKKRLL